MLARQILDAAERYCAGIGGDPRGEMPPEDRWAAYLVQVGLAGRLAAQQDLSQAVQVSFAMLSKAHSAGAEDQAGDAIEGGVSRLLAALNHRSDVPERSGSLALADLDADEARPGEERAPEPLSGALPGPRLGAMMHPGQPDLFGGALVADLAPTADQGAGGPAGGAGAPRPPSLPLPDSVGVDSQNFDSDEDRP